MIKAPRDGAGGRGNAKESLAQNRPLNQVVYPPVDPYILTNGYGQFVALLYSDTAKLLRLPKTVQA